MLAVPYCPLNPLFFLIFIFLHSSLIPSQVLVTSRPEFYFLSYKPIYLLIPNLSLTCPYQHLLLCPWPQWWVLLSFRCALVQARNLGINLNSSLPTIHVHWITGYCELYFLNFSHTCPFIIPLFGLNLQFLNLLYHPPYHQSDVSKMHISFYHHLA